MIEIDLPDGSVAEFPDGTTDDTIKQALRTADVKAAARDRLKTMGPLRKALYGGERALTENYEGIKDLTKGLTPAEERDIAISREVEEQIPGSSVSRIGAELGMWAIPASKVVQGAAMLPRAAALARYGGAAALSAAQAALKPTIGEEDRGDNARTGAVWGLAGQGIGDAAGRVVRGIVPKSDAARALPQEVQDAATLGQVADKTTTMGRFINGTEEKIKSIFGLGNIVENARDRGANAWRDEIVDRVSPAGFRATAESTRDKLGQVYREFQDRYTKALRGHSITPSQQFEQRILAMTNDPKNGLSQRQAQEIADDIMRNYQGRFAAAPGNRGPAGTALTQPGVPPTPIAMAGEEAKGFEGFLSGRARQYRKGQMPLDPDIARFYQNAEDVWSTVYRRQLGPQVRRELRPLDERYAPFKTVERAASSVGPIGGDFTSSQLTNAVASRTGKVRFGRGEGMLADDAQRGKSVFQDRVANSGTTDRAMLVGTMGGLIVDPVTTLSVGAGTAATLPMFTTAVGKNFMTGETRAQRFLRAMRAQDRLSEAGPAIGITGNELTNDRSIEY